MLISSNKKQTKETHKVSTNRNVEHKETKRQLSSLTNGSSKVKLVTGVDGGGGGGGLTKAKLEENCRNGKATNVHKQRGVFY